MPEILFYSSNIGAAKMALDVGTKAQRDYLDRLGLLHPPAIELPEVGSPLTPAPWRQINTMTIAYGHGIAVSPLQVTAAVATIVNGGIRRPPTLLYLPDGTHGRRRPGVVGGNLAPDGRPHAPGRQPGHGPKGGCSRLSGSAARRERRTRLSGGRYRPDALISSFVGAFPIDRPRYVVIVLLDEPKGNDSTNGFATGGWVAAPAVGRIVKRMAPLAGILPAATGGKPEGHRLASLVGASCEGPGETTCGSLIS